MMKSRDCRSVPSITPHSHDQLVMTQCPDLPTEHETRFIRKPDGRRAVVRKANALYEVHDRTGRRTYSERQIERWLPSCSTWEPEKVHLVMIGEAVSTKGGDPKQAFQDIRLLETSRAAREEKYTALGELEDDPS